MAALSLTYALSIPTGAPLASTPGARSSDSFSRPLSTTTPRAQLESLEAALGEAREWLNPALTEWKDALKGVEKERKLPKGEDDEEPDE